MKYKKIPGVGVLNTEPEKENCGLKNFAATDVQEIEDHEDDFICPACCCGIHIELPEE